MARGKKVQTISQTRVSAQGRAPLREQANDVIFALDIGTRSIIGMVGIVEDGKVRVTAVEKEDHTERAMMDGQIENIEKVANLAGKVKERLEGKTRIRLTRVCVAAAGRALKTKRAEFELHLPGTQLIDDEIISRLEAGAITRAEEAFDAENEAKEDMRRFYLVGYSVCQYFLDQYTISSLKDHRGQDLKVDLIATFLPSEVVESLYTTMHKIGLEVASLTLEPIAAINAAIPENIRLLNLVMVDIGAGTSDIAACTGGSITGYTMATVAGDEITETIMKHYLVDFSTAERMKMELEDQEEIAFSNILGIEQKLSTREIFQAIQGSMEALSKEIADKVVEINGMAPSALFLVGGGSKLARLKDGITAALGMDDNRVTVAGNYFQVNAYSKEFDLNNPEYATPLGIMISSGLNLINDSFRVTLNGKPAKLFRSGSFTALNLLMMNGYNFRDIMGRSGANLTVMANGARKVFYGTASEPAALFINQKEGKLSDVIHAGDFIEFTPSVPGSPASACLGDLEGAAEGERVMLNGKPASLDTKLKNGDVVTIIFPEPEEEEIAEERLNASAIPEMEEEEPGEMPSPSEIKAEKSVSSPEMSVEESVSPLEMKAGESVSSLEMKAGESGSSLEMKAGETDSSPEMKTGEPFPSPEMEAAESFSPPETEGEKAKAAVVEPMVSFHLNGAPLRLPKKGDGRPYYLMDLIQHSGIDLENPKGTVELQVNGAQGRFQQVLKEGDVILIREKV